MPELKTALMGTWTGTVSHDEESDDYTVTLEDDGSVALVTRRSRGTGRWVTTGDDSFLLTLKEVFHKEVNQHSPNGMAAEYIQINIDARVSGDTFSGSGTAAVHGPDDTVIYSTQAQTTAARVGSQS